MKIKKLNANSKKRIKILGCYLDCLTMEETLIKVEEIIKNNIPKQHVVINASKVLLAKENEKLRKIINSCELINADGMSIIWAGRFLGNKIPEKVSGIDLMYELIKLSELKKYKIYFLGARKEVIELAIENVKRDFPDLNVSGFHNGYFKEEEDDNVIKDIKNCEADILFVGISSPKKEYWLNKNIIRLNVPFCMGVGGSFDILAGHKKRAPKWIQRIGFEWFYRFIQEPRRLWRRYLIGNVKFFWLILFQKLKQTYKRSENKKNST